VELVDDSNNTQDNKPAIPSSARVLWTNKLAVPSSVEVLKQITNPETQKKFETAKQTYAKLWERINLTSPSLDEFAAAGVNFAKLAQTFEQMEEQMERDSLEPRIVISKPMPLAPDGSGNSWRELYTQLTADSISDKLPNPRLKSCYPRNHDDDNGNDPGLWVNSDIYKQSQSILEQEVKRIEAGRTNSTIHPVDDSSNSPWTIAILPGTTKPQQLDTDHTTNQGRHVSVSQYLALQAALIQTGESPIDNEVDDPYFSWMNETLSEGSQALRVSCLSELGRVRVFNLSAKFSDAYLGTRLVRWG
jgi:hypothetical protein